MKVPINSIIIGERQRLDLGDLSDLATMSDPSIGQIVPIIVHKTPKGIELVEGRRRIEKATQLGWTHIDAYERDNLTPTQKQLFELFADIGRKDRTWQEKCLAVSKIHLMMKVEKMSEGKTWTQEAMSSFTGIERSNIGYMLQVAAALRAEPKDEEVWAAAGYVPAVQVLVSRNQRKAYEELERRRSLNLAAASRCLESAETEEEEDADEGETQPESEAKESVVIQLHGKCSQFIRPEQTKYPAVLAYDPPVKALLSYSDCLEDTGFIVIWVPRIGKALEFIAEAKRLQLPHLPFMLIWDKVELPTSPWPYAAAMEFGVVFQLHEPVTDWNEPTGPIVAAVQTSPDLATSVIGYSLLPFLPEGQPVLLPTGIGPAGVAACGYIPVWFEPDPNAFSKKMEELKNYYTSTLDETPIFK